MKISSCSANLAFLALIAAGLLAVPPEKSQAQEPENFAWITNTNGLTWKREILPRTDDELNSFYFDDELNSFYLDPAEGVNQEIAQIVVPEHAIIAVIDVKGCVNLTNIVIRTDLPKTHTRDGRVRVVNSSTGEQWLRIDAGNTGLINITCSKAMRDRILLRRGTEWWPIYWTELELSKLEIRTHTTANGPEVEIVWRDGKLQIADAVNGEYRDHLGSSPLRFPLAAAKDKQFFRIAKIESPTTEEPPTPQQ